MFREMKSNLEKIKITPFSWILGFSGVLMVRFFLEAFSSRTSSGVIASDAPTLIHYYLFFLSVAFSTLLILHFALPSWRKVLPQFISIAFVFILLAPIIDWSVSSGQGLTMTYLFQTPRELLHSFLTFFGPNIKQGITIGIRVELATILILSGLLIYSENKNQKNNLLKTLGFVLTLYLVVFFFGALPSIISFGQSLEPLTFLTKSIVASGTFTDNLHTTLLYSSANRALETGFNFLMSKILFLISTTLVSVYFLLNYKQKFLAVIKNSRPERVLAYFSVIFFGILLSQYISPAPVLSWSDVISVLVLLLSFYFSWVFSVCTNDVADEDIDKISNGERPLIQGVLSVEDLKQTSYIFLFGSLLAGFLSGFYALFSVLAFTALYYIYSVPPTRFKQIPFFSSFLISLCKLSCLLAGFFIFSGSKVLSTLPTEAIVGTVTFFTLFVHLRDLKDIEGDRALGIKTPAVVFGQKFIGVLVAVAYLLLPTFFHVELLYFISIPAALLSYYFCTRKPYRELPLFIIYFIFVFIVLSAIYYLQTIV